MKGGEMAGGERAELLQSLERHRGFLRHTVRGLSDEEAARRTTVSELCLGGLVKHVTSVEKVWMAFVLGGAEAMGASREGDWASQFRMVDGDTLDGLLAAYDDGARRTEEVVMGLPDLDVSQPLPQAPWFEPGASWSARRVLLHVLAETSQHAGHADIIREALDGQKTMG